MYLLFHWPGISLPSGRPRRFLDLLSPLSSLPSGRPRRFLDLLSPLSCPHPSISDPSPYSHPVATVSTPSMARHLSPFREGPETFSTLYHHCLALIHNHSMAAVSAPSVARHLSPFRKAQKISRTFTTTVLPLSITTQWLMYLLLQWPGISLPSGRPIKFLDLLSPLSCPHPSISDPSLYSHPVAAVSAPSVARHLSPFTKAQKISQPSTTTVLPLSITTQWLLYLFFHGQASLLLQDGSENFLTLCNHCPPHIHQYSIPPSITAQWQLYLVPSAQVY